jgi:transcriptional regulator with XRE-family HTH domain
VNTATTTQHNLAAIIRAAITSSQHSRYHLSNISGVSQGVLSRFMAGKRDLTLETASRLCEALGLVLRPQGRRSNAHCSAHSAAASSPERSRPNLTRALSLQEAIRAAMQELGPKSPLPGIVSLTALRVAIPHASQQETDAALLSLRRQGVLSLSLAENRLAVSAVDRAAMLIHDGREYWAASLR